MRSLDAQSLRGSLAFTGALGTACKDWRKALLLDPSTQDLEQKGTAFDNRSLSLGLCNTSAFVFFFFF